jgi:hypothetical protein
LEVTHSDVVAGHVLPGRRSRYAAYFIGAESGLLPLADRLGAYELPPWAPSPPGTAEAALISLCSGEVVTVHGSTFRTTCDRDGLAFTLLAQDEAGSEAW